MVDRAAKHEPAPQAMSPYGDYDTMLSTVVSQLRKGPYVLGERFSAADVLWGTSLGWMTMFDLVPKLPEITDYASRISSRPAALRVQAKDTELAAAQQETG